MHVNNLVFFMQSLKRIFLLEKPSHSSKEWNICTNKQTRILVSTLSIRYHPKNVIDYSNYVTQRLIYSRMDTTR